MAFDELEHWRQLERQGKQVFWELNEYPILQTVHEVELEHVIQFKGHLVDLQIPFYFMYWFGQVTHSVVLVYKQIWQLEAVSHCKQVDGAEKNAFP